VSFYSPPPFFGSCWITDDLCLISERLTLPLWRSISSLNLMLPKEERRAMLLRLFKDESPLIDHSQQKEKHRAAAAAAAEAGESTVVEVEDAEMADVDVDADAEAEAEAEKTDEQQQGDNVEAAAASEAAAVVQGEA
jgi:multisite-specific tRNA:(cytosine-C5)-methyltransferase